MISIRRILKKPNIERGFTLTELLVVMIISGFILVAGFTTILNLLQTDRRAQARSESQREIQQALAYISTDLQSALYIFTPALLETLKEANVGIINASNTLTNGGGVPVVAFWTRIPCISAAVDAVNANCVTPATRYTYSLVVYGLKTTELPQRQKGPAIITRTAYQPSATNGFRNPTDQFTWNPDTAFSGYASTVTYQVLLDYVDNHAPDGVNKGLDFRCPLPTASVTLPQIPSAAGSLSSFYACVPNTATAQIFIRGNALQRANLPLGNTPSVSSSMMSYLPMISTQVIARGGITTN